MNKIASCTIGGKTYDFACDVEGAEVGRKVWVKTARGEAKARIAAFKDETEYEGELAPVLRLRPEDEGEADA